MPIIECIQIQTLPYCKIDLNVKLFDLTTLAIPSFKFKSPGIPSETETYSK